MRYIDHIRAMSDADFAYFLNFLQPEIELFALAMERTLQWPAFSQLRQTQSQRRCKIAVFYTPEGLRRSNAANR